VRTTLTLDPDVAAKLKSQSKKSGRPFREVVNEALRRGLEKPRSSGPRQRFVVQTRDLGDLAPGLNLDNIGDLLEQAEGPHHR
jgi:hypothetical protein